MDSRSPQPSWQVNSDLGSLVFPIQCKQLTARGSSVYYMVIWCVALGDSRMSARDCTNQLPGLIEPVIALGKSGVLCSRLVSLEEVLHAPFAIGLSYDTIVVVY